MDRYQKRVAVLQLLVLSGLLICLTTSTFGQALKAERLADRKQRNVIFILVDDHRYDAMGFMGHPFLKTPHMDAMAAGGIHFKNAFVTTSLCSPSRASILTGQYMHNHRVVDNNNLVPEGTIFFPQYLQKVGYETAYVGKWHMGGASDDPRPGFDHWVSFRGQGRYYPRKGWMLNINGKRSPQKGYVTDEMTDHAIDWLNNRPGKGEKPFFLYLSHKAVHAEFAPAERHKGVYKDAKWTPPATMANTPENYKGKPRWVKDQRNSWHGVDYAYHSTQTPIEQLYKNYCETLLGVDDSVGRVNTWLKKNGLYDSTIVIYMGDNGFLWGEHGLIDKRNAYAESMRVPMMATCPELFGSSGKVVDGVVANIDIGPTILEAAGVKTPGQMDGRSWLALAEGKIKLDQWRDFLLYEYYWEYNFPHTPTVFALRGNQYKFIQYHGIWDIDELYDIQKDPHETTNLIFEPSLQGKIRQLRARLFEEMKKTNGDRIPLAPKRSHGQALRTQRGSKPSDFPPQFIRE